METQRAIKETSQSEAPVESDKILQNQSCISYISISIGSSFIDSNKLSLCFNIFTIFPS